MPLSTMVEQMQAFQFEHSGCTKIMEKREVNRKRYRLHTECRKAGLTVNPKDRDVTGWDETNLPPPAIKLRDEHHYTFQHTIE